MKIHKEGYRTLVISTAVAAVIIVITAFLLMPVYPILG